MFDFISTQSVVLLLIFAGIFALALPFVKTFVASFLTFDISPTIEIPKPDSRLESIRLIEQLESNFKASGNTKALELLAEIGRSMFEGQQK
jgi:hypothetical protein